MIAILIKTTDEVEIIDIVAGGIDEELRAMQGFVGGYIEHVRPRGLPRPYCMIVNEEGLVHELPRNSAASALCDGIAPIVGDVLILKDDIDENGDGVIVGIEPYAAQIIAEKLCLRFPFLTLVQ